MDVVLLEGLFKAEEVGLKNATAVVSVALVRVSLVLVYYPNSMITFVERLLRGINAILPPRHH